MHHYNAAIRAIPMPHRIASLPVSPKGFPVPWFVAEINGAYDFRVIGPGKVQKATRWHKCWICGQMMGKFQAVVVGPMCTVHRVTADPGSHRDCAMYAAVACPFLSNPAMRRRADNLPEDKVEPPGTMIGRNPGVTAVWVSDAALSSFRVGGGVLFNLPSPTEVRWFAEGRAATRQEAVDSIASGMPILMEAAEKEDAFAVRGLKRVLLAAMQYLPAAPAGKPNGLVETAA